MCERKEEWEEEKEKLLQWKRKLLAWGGHFVENLYVFPRSSVVERQRKQTRKVWVTKNIWKRKLCQQSPPWLFVDNVIIIIWIIRNFGNRKRRAPPREKRECSQPRSSSGICTSPFCWSSHLSRIMVSLNWSFASFKKNSFSFQIVQFNFAKVSLDQSIRENFQLDDVMLW